MTRLSLAALSIALLLASYCCPAESQPAPERDKPPAKASRVPAPEPDDEAEAKVKAQRAFVKEHLDRLQRSDLCKKGSKHRLRAICTPAREFNKAKGSEPPLDQAWVGFTLFVKSEGEVASFADTGAHVSLLAFNKRGSSYKARVSGVQQNTPSDKAYASALLDDVLRTFKEKTQEKKLALEPRLFGYAQSMPAKAHLDALPHKRGFFLVRPEGQGAFGDVRKVGDVWIAIEAPRNPQGVYVSVFKAIPVERGPAL